MTDKPISPLRQRMIEDMTARRFAEKIQNDYIRYVKNFAAFLGRSPDAATAEDLRLFQLHMAKTHVSPWTINATIVALRFFFKVTLERDDLVRRLTLVRELRRAPTVLSPEEVARLLEAASDAKYKAALGRRLWRWSTRVRGRRVEGLRHRQQAHAAPRRARQGAKRSLCHALAATAGVAERLVAGRSPTGLAVSRARPGQPDVDSATLSRRFRRGAGGGNRQTRVAAHAAPQLRNSSARTERRYQGHPSPAQNSHILLVNRIARGRYTIGSIPNAVRPCLFSDNSPAGELIWSPFRNRMGPSHAFPRG